MKTRRLWEDLTPGDVIVEWRNSEGVDLLSLMKPPFVVVNVAWEDNFRHARQSRALEINVIDRDGDMSSTLTVFKDDTFRILA